MSKNTKDVVEDKDYSLERVPATARKGFWPMFFIMLGFTFFSASMSVGAKLGIGLNLQGFIWAVLIGSIVLGAYTGVLGYIGSHTGMSLDLLAQHSFGKKGSYLPSALISFTQIGWFGVGAAMFAIPAAEVLHVSPVVLVVIAGVCMTLSAYRGIEGLEIVSYISVPLIAILGIYSMNLAIGQGGGLEAVFAKSQGTLTIAGGAGLVIGSFVSGGTATPNFTRYAKTNKIAIVTTVIAFFLGNALMFAFGATGGAFTGKSTTLDAPTTKTTGAILVTVEFPDLHGATMGILVCACGGSEERMREIASKMNAKVVSMCKCKQAIENKPGAPLKCLRPGNCPGQVKNNMQFKKDKCEYILIGNCSDCSNTVMASGPKMGLKVFHQTDHVMRTVGHPLYRSLKVSKEVSQEIDF